MTARDRRAWLLLALAGAVAAVVAWQLLDGLDTTGRYPRTLQEAAFVQCRPIQPPGPCWVTFDDERYLVKFVWLPQEGGGRWVQAPTSQAPATTRAAAR